ncbi:MAG: hypothetical protein ACOZJX_09985 [Pseudomonadota bacterium]
MRAIPTLFAPLLVAFAATTSAGPTFAAGAGVELNDRSSPAEVGLPAYPGATVRRDKPDDGEGLNLSLWGGSLGFKLALVKFSTTDPVDKVAAYYREAMGRYGTVLDCTGPRPAAPPADKKVLACNKDDKGEPGGKLYKVGTPQQQRIVSIKPAGGRVEFDMVRVETSQ